MSDVDCPYCGKGQEICHDDGAGYDENSTHEQQCSDCDKYFAFTTSVCFHYEAAQAPCMNGGEHKWKPVYHSPPNWPDWVRCEDCDEDKRGEFQASEDSP